MFLLESPQRGDSNEYTQYTISQYKKENILNYPKSATMGFHLFQGTQERAQDGRGKRAISVRAIEVLLYYIYVKVTGVIIMHSSSQETFC